MSQPREPRGRVRFRERESARLARAVRAAGGGKITLDPETGTYTVEIAGEVPTAAPASDSDLDNWIAKRDARPA
jgi:hypothetical protein